MKFSLENFLAISIPIPPDTPVSKIAFIWLDYIKYFFIIKKVFIKLLLSSMIEKSRPVL